MTQTASTTSTTTDLVPTIQQKEPMLLLDTTGSMAWPSSATDTTPRRNVVREAIGIIVDRLAAADSQAEHEEDEGGLRTITFANGTAVDIGDLNPGNLHAIWDRIHWGGGTLIVPGLNKLLQVFTGEFGSKPQADRPLLMALVITDGEAEDTQTFCDLVARAAGSMYIALAIVGFGTEHDRAVQAYKQVQSQNSHVKVLSFAGETDPNVIATALLSMV